MREYTKKEVIALLKIKTEVRYYYALRACKITHNATGRITHDEFLRVKEYREHGRNIAKSPGFKLNKNR